MQSRAHPGFFHRQPFVQLIPPAIRPTSLPLNCHFSGSYASTPNPTLRQQPVVSRMTWPNFGDNALSLLQYHTLPPLAAAIPYIIRCYLLSVINSSPSWNAWRSLSHLRIGSDNTGQVVISSTPVFRRALGSMSTLQTLRLIRFAWAPDDHPENDACFAAYARPKDFSIWAERDWLLDKRSVYLLTWIARSGFANAMQAIHFEWMTILDDPLLAATAEVIEASSGALRGILIRAGPDVCLLPLLQAFHSCGLLQQLFVYIPYHQPTFRAFTEFARQLDIPQLRRLNVRLCSYSGCTHPQGRGWVQLDSALQFLQCPQLYCISVLKLAANLECHALTWGNIYENVKYDPCPQVYGRVVLWVPIEVCEHTIDLVAHSQSGSLGLIRASGVVRILQACALTCRAWRARAQAHLFRIVRVRCGPAQAYSTAAFVALLGAHPALRTFVRTCIAAPGPSAAPPTLHALPLHLPRSLAALAHLRLPDGVLYAAPGFEVCMRQFASVTTLSLLGVTFHSLTSLRHTLAACRNATTVHVLLCQWHGKCPAAPLGRFPRTPVRLAELALAGDAAWTLDRRTLGLLHWLGRSDIMSAATGIFLHTMVILDEAQLAAVDGLISAARHTLTDLYLSFAPDTDFDSLCTTLAACPKLDLVALRLPYCTSTFKTLIALFSTEGIGLATRELHIWLRLHAFPGADEPSAADWAALDDALQLPFHAALANLTVGRWPLNVPAGAPVVWGENYGYAAREADPAVGEEIKARLPKTMKRKGLRLRWDRVL
ncbi:hypothetical protein PsYK624_166530 [Phanerochaete sordida]|uniref:Uncharacterized protein n=1 Tax=Phanerochaete sordida TaxID=48140 RepID=A0A9P3GSZ4_9APHY|nr:hypothetical protein PsYK624_166530 [Phanerochaete sordida]